MATTVQGKPPPPTSGQLASERTDLATARTMMAVDRSLMAWIRTGLSMISFGFTIYKLLESFQEKGALGVDMHSPRTVGLFLTGLGTISVLMGTIEYWQRRRQLLAFSAVRIWRPAFIMALLMSATGLVLFFGIISKLF